MNTVVLESCRAQKQMESLEPKIKKNTDPRKRKSRRKPTQSERSANSRPKNSKKKGESNLRRKV